MPPVITLFQDYTATLLVLLAGATKKASAEREAVLWKTERREAISTAAANATEAIREVAARQRQWLWWPPKQRLSLWLLLAIFFL